MTVFISLTQIPLGDLYSHLSNPGSLSLFHSILLDDMPLPKHGSPKLFQRWHRWLYALVLYRASAYIRIVMTILFLDH